MKNVGENEANRFCFPLTLWPPGKVSQWKWYKMVEVNCAYAVAGIKTYGCSNLNSLCVMSNIRAFATQDGQLAGQTRLIT